MSAKTNNFHAREDSVSNVLRNFRPRVPALQRNYSWDTPEWRDLWEDLFSFFKDNSTNNRKYFIGAIVLVKRDDFYEILDGQQRLATLTILLSALIAALEKIDPKKAGVYEQLGLKEEGVNGIEEYYVTLNMYDEEYFRKRVQRWNEEQPKYRSHELIEKACKFFSARIDEVRDQNQSSFSSWLNGFTNAILTRIYFAYVETNSEDSYQIFRVLNDRGKSLSQLDLFRNLLLERAPPKERGEIAANWTQVLDLAEPAKPDDLLRFYWITRVGDVKATRLFRDIEGALTKKKIALTGETITSSELADELFLYADMYQDLVVGTSNDRRTQDWLRAIIALQARSLYPLLLSARWAQGTVGFNDKKFLALLKLSVSLYLRHTLISGLENFRLEAEVYKAAFNLRQTGNIDAAMAALRAYGGSVVPDKTFHKRFADASVDREAPAKYIMTELELGEWPNGEIAIKGGTEVHLEHIYPRSAKVRWSDHDDWLWRLGNLTLIAGQKNRKAYNKDFSEKKVLYGESDLKLTVLLAKLKAWDKMAIQKRQMTLAQKATELWSLD